MGKAQLPRRRFYAFLPENAGRGSPASFTPTARPASLRQAASTT